MNRSGREASLLASKEEYPIKVGKVNRKSIFFRFQICLRFAPARSLQEGIVLAKIGRAFNEKKSGIYNLK